jgi:drug/metabolite transporter (DMT)-like permease
MLLALAFIWGGSFFLAEIMLLEMSPFQIVFHRVGIAALVMYAFMRFRGKTLPKDVKSWAVLAVMGLLNNAIPFSAIVFGQQYITGGLASILNSTTAFFGVIIPAIFLSEEHITITKLTGVTLGVIGVVVIIGIETLSQLSLSSIGQYLIIVSSISYAFASVWGRLYVRDLGIEVTATGMLITSTVWMFILSMMVEGVPLEILSPQSAAAALTMAILCTSIAYLLYFGILAEAGASNLMLVTIIIPVFALILDALFLGDLVSGTDMAGFAIIAIGLLVIAERIKLPKRTSRKKAAR